MYHPRHSKKETLAPSAPTEPAETLTKKSSKRIVPFILGQPARILVASLILCLTACSSPDHLEQSRQTPSPSPTATSTSTRATSTPSATPSPTPSATPSPIYSASPLPLALEVDPPAAKESTAELDAVQQPLATPAQEVYYANCSAAREAGAAPLYIGQAGYRQEMDGDGDGIACEPYSSPAQQGSNDQEAAAGLLAAPNQAPAQEVYYANCSAAREAGAAPLYIGQAGYRQEMDGDGDGIACEARG